MEKILFITNDFPPQSGGIETFIEGLIRQIPQGSVVVHTSTQRDLAAQESFDQRIYDELGVVVVRDRQRILLPIPALAKRVAGTIHAHAVTKVVFGASVPLGLLAPRLRKLGVKKMIAITHGHEVWWSKVPLFAHALRRVARHVDHITYLGSFTKSVISKAVDREDEVKLVHLPPGVDINIFRPEKEKAAGKNILCVGRLVQRKGQDVLIKAMARIRDIHPDAHLLIAGEGNYEAKLRALVAKCGVSESVTFTGRILDTELPELFRSTDIFASPTRERFGGLEVEGLGIVYLEASASGIPVIAGASGGSPDAVQIAVTGLVVDGRSVEEVAQALDELLADSAKRKAMGARGREWMEREWSWQVIGARFSKLLQLYEI